MRGLILLICGLLAVSTYADEAPIHLDFYGSRAEYEGLYQNYMQQRLELLEAGNPSPQRDLDPIVQLGRRNLEWLDHINELREEPLAFSSKETQKGIPIEEPKVYGPSTIYPEHDEILEVLPEQMHRVLILGQDFEGQLEISDEDYITYGRRVDRLYQTTVRWLSLSGWKHWYAQRKRDDVRGYFFLSQRDQIISELENFDSLPSETQTQLEPLLINICENGHGSWQSCPDLYLSHKAEGRLVDFYQRFIESARDRYNEYFHLEVQRRDTHWDSDSQMNFPFKTPDSQEVRDWLVENIEDEWQWEDWKLVLNFSPSAGPRVRFRPNVTPNVNGLGGNIITMNSLVSLQDYNVQWTIRHEFGHVLGFPDCYVEFYEAETNVFVNYQIDITNLMCSRTGELKQTHYDELKRVYKEE
mgnify:CR=1 FL=1|tara:strand:+ start:20709 stop:21950 length:1242 start_codon:yes stop_codon:yes gene_type:complete